MNYLHKNLVRLFNLFFLQLIFVSFAAACMCPDGNSVGSEFNKSSNIIKARLEPFKIDVQEGETPNDSIRDLSLIKKSLPRLIVQKVFKGNLQVGDVLEFDGVYRCSLPLAQVGGDYLLYLGEKPTQGELWQLPGCSKSGLLEHRLADLLYIGKEKKVRSKTRLAGRLFFDKDSISSKNESRLPTLVNRKVYIVGEKHQFEAKTNEEGVYEIYDLPTGTYKIFPENINGWNSKVSNYDSDVVEITGFGQFERDFKYETVASISGNFFDVSELSAKACLNCKTCRN